MNRKAILGSALRHVRSQGRLYAVSNGSIPVKRPQRNNPLYQAQASLSTSAWRGSDNGPVSFSDAHFGQERDREEQRRKQRGAKDKDAIEGESKSSADAKKEEQGPGTYSEADHEHAVISTFDLFSIGIGPSSSHTVGPMRAGNIFINDLHDAGLLQDVEKIRISLYGSLAATGEGHMTPSALLLGLESADVETVDTGYVPIRFDEIRDTKKLFLGKALSSQGGKEVDFDYEKDLIWEWGKSLPMHSNGMRLTVFDKDGTMLATNDLFSVGGGFVVNGALSTAASSKSVKESASSQSDTTLPLADPNDAASDLSGHPADLAENMYYKEIRRADAAIDRRSGMEIKSDESESAALPPPPSDSTDLTNSHSTSSNIQESESSGRGSSPRYPFRDAKSLLALCKKHNLTIAQIVYENEKSQGYTDEEIREKVWAIWTVMDNSIKEGVRSNDEILPGSLKLNRRAPALYRRLTRGLYPSHALEGPSMQERVRKQVSEGETSKAGQRISEGPHSQSVTSHAQQSSGEKSLTSMRKRGPPRVHGSFQHPILPSPPRRTSFPAIDYLTVYAMAVNEVNAAGGRIVTAPTNGAAGILPAVLKYHLEFQSDDVEQDVFTFLLTAAAIGMLYKRGATISAAEGGCMAEVGVACSMASGAFAACMGASPETIEQAAEIGIEHNLGLTCDPIGGLVQAPCIERNALGAIKAISSANLALSSSGTQKISLDDAIRAMRLTAQGMRNEFKETSLSGLATSYSISVSVPDC
ncbi:L-serine ammonia-lyase [Meira miltonrushii]|uniref:L-serine ammonia-lyase n=1 Tax=Meira miltonrushii TaxID=1280837 RepID=A0A316VGM6_9BASI|nr:L-serine ammonia-lyase [Meira miltonrushii]PWN35151.1 L-serine ammonia-lyase [Meira miltonrushii]